MPRGWWGWSVLGSAGLIASASAQSVVRGSVRADSTSRPVPGASISTEGPVARSTLSGASGDFVLDGVDPGRVTLVFRAVGFRPFRAVAELSGSDTLELDVRLAPLVTQLAPVEVVANRARWVSGKMEEFERRRRAGFGKFLTRADLEPMETGPMSHVLRLAAGVRLVPLQYDCGTGFALATSRQAPDVPLTMACGGSTERILTQACYLDVYVDGSHLWRWGQGPPPNIEQFTIRDYQAIEIYRGRSELPAELDQPEPACGAIMFWTRTGEP